VCQAGDESLPGRHVAFRMLWVSPVPRGPVVWPAVSAWQTRTVSIDDLPPAEFAYPGPLRDKLVAAILAGDKTATTSLKVQYDTAGDPLPAAGERTALVDSAGNRVAVVETIDVRVVRLGDVDLAFARAEGEGFASVAEWRAAHERFWTTSEAREEIPDDFVVDDDALVVQEFFRVDRSA